MHALGVEAGEDDLIIKRSVSIGSHRTFEPHTLTTAQQIETLTD